MRRAVTIGSRPVVYPVVACDRIIDRVTRASIAAIGASNSSQWEYFICEQQVGV